MKLGLGTDLNRNLLLKANPIIEIQNPSSQDFLTSSYSELGDFKKWSIDIGLNYTAPPSTNARIFDFRYNGNNNIILFFYSNGNAQLVITRDGEVEALPTFSQEDYFAKQGLTKLTVTYADNQIDLFINGRRVMKTLSGQSIDVPSSAPVVLSLGQTYGGSAALTNSTFSSFAFYNKKLPSYFCKLLGTHDDFGINATYDSNKYGLSELGQSNSVGSATDLAEAPTYNNISSMEKVTKDGIKESYSDPACDVGTGSIFPVLSQDGQVNSSGMLMDYIVQETGLDTICMNANRGSTGLIDGGGGHYWGPYINSGKMEVLQPLAYGSSIYESILRLYAPLKWRTWRQGESDAGASVSSANYEEALKEMISFLNQHNTVKTLIYELHHKEGYDDIRAAQANVASNIKDVYLATSEDLETISGDDTHLSVNGLAVSAYRGAETILSVDGHITQSLSVISGHQS